jgi:hypothetical protein
MGRNVPVIIFQVTVERQALYSEGPGFRSPSGDLPSCSSVPQGNTTAYLTITNHRIIRRYTKPELLTSLAIHNPVSFLGQVIWDLW